MPLNQNELKALEQCVEEDEAQVHAMRAPGGTPRETLATATAKALGAGVTLKAIFAAIITGYMTGGLAGAIAAVLALLATP